MVVRQKDIDVLVQFVELRYSEHKIRVGLFVLRDEFGRHLRKLREERGWTQEKLAEMSGLSDREIRRIERACSAVGIDSLEKLAKAFNMHPRDLFDFLYP